MKYITLLLTFMVNLSLSQVHFNLHKAPDWFMTDLDFPPISQAIRVFNFEFRANAALLYMDHFGISTPVRINNHGVKIYRGIFFGSSTNHGGRPCIFPSVWFETYNTGNVYHPDTKCVEIIPTKLYKVSLHVSEDWLAYSLYNESGMLIDQHAINASEMWYNLEETSTSLVLQSLKDFNIATVSEKQSVLHIRNLTLGYYLIK